MRSTSDLNVLTVDLWRLRGRFLAVVYKELGGEERLEKMGILKEQIEEKPYLELYLDNFGGKGKRV
jgi:hypothetical protein